MERRQLLTLIAAATGCALAGYAEFGPDRDARAGPADANFAPTDVAFFDEVAETIVPRTDTPGAKDAKVGAFIAAYSQACYSQRDLPILRAGIDTLNGEMRKACGATLVAARPAQREAVLTRIDREARAMASKAGDDDPPHYFTLMKQLTLLGFFTSEPGATKAARYSAIPGPYHGDIPYDGKGFWSWA